MKLISKVSEKSAKGVSKRIVRLSDNLAEDRKQCITGQMFPCCCQATILSFSSMLIHSFFCVVPDTLFSPQQRVLPRNRQTGKRKPGMKIRLSRLKKLPDQLAPFFDLWNFDQDMDYYPGTIFRFPLRQGNSDLMLPTKSGPLGPDMVSRMLGDYFHEARKSLLYLKRIQSIEFKVEGNPNSGWSISRPPPRLNTCFTQVTCSYTRQSGFKQQVSGEDEWWIATEDLDKRTDDTDSRMVSKNIECSVGALVSSNCRSSSLHVNPPRPPRPGFFKTLPLQIASDLPVHIHATFDLTGDRQSVILTTEGESEHSTYNKYLLQVVIPKLYLGLMTQLVLGPLPNNEVFRFWPTQPEPRKLNCSDLIAAAFWERVAKDPDITLFPRASLVTGQRRTLPEPPQTLDGSVFDFLPKEQSALLRSLLLSLNVKLAQNVPEHVERSLRALPIHEVTGDLLRRLLNSSLRAMCLRAEQAKNHSILTTVLELALPTSPNQVELLHGCYILPLLDGTFSEIVVLDEQNEQKKSSLKEYYLATETEVKLFHFASSVLVPPAFRKTFQHLLGTRKINVTLVEPRNVGNLLDLRKPPGSVNKNTDAWLESFWKFWNKISDKSSRETDGDIEALGLVFKSTCNEIAKYHKFSDLDALPAIVEPAELEHRRLCKKIPGLFLFDNALMHAQLKRNEASLSESAPFLRFIKSLRKLSSASNLASIGDFLARHLNEDDFKVFLLSLCFAVIATRC